MNKPLRCRYCQSSFCPLFIVLSKADAVGQSANAGAAAIIVGRSWRRTRSIARSFATARSSGGTSIPNIRNSAASRTQLSLAASESAGSLLDLRSLL